MQFKLTFEDGSDGYLAQAELDPKEVERRHYAFPEERKFPLTDASKVMSAIKFFNYVDPKNERHLAEAILKRMEELGISEVNVGPNNRFKKYYEAQDGYLEHYGVKGMHWGVWNEETRARRMGLHKPITKTSSENRKGLSDKQKKAIMVGAAVTAGVLAVAGGIYVGKMLSGSWYGVSTISSDPLKNYIETMDDTPVSLKKRNENTTYFW